MKVFAIVIATVIACACAHHEDYPNYVPPYAESRHRRDVTLDRKTANGRVFGTLGQNENGLFGRGGYEHNILNDHRGKLDGSVHGTRVLGPNGDSSHLGGSLNWQNRNAAASLDVSKQLHGRTSVGAAAGGHWPVGKNGDLSAQGFYNQQGGVRDYGGRGVFNYRF